MLYIGWRVLKTSTLQQKQKEKKCSCSPRSGDSPRIAHENDVCDVKTVKQRHPRNRDGRKKYCKKSELFSQPFQSQSITQKTILTFYNDCN